MHNLSPLQPPADPTQQLPSPINMPKADPRRGREHLPTASSHMLQQKGSSDAACIVHQQLAESAEGNNCYCSWVKGATCTPSPHFTRCVTHASYQWVFLLCCCGAPASCMSTRVLQTTRSSLWPGPQYCVDCTCTASNTARESSRSELVDL